MDLYAQVLTNRGQTWQLLMDYPAALRDCNKAISVKAGHMKAYFRKIQVCR